MLTDAQQDQIARTFLSLLPDFVARSRQATPHLDDAARVVDAARDAYERWRDDLRAQARLGMDAYVDALQARRQALDEALAELARQEAQANATVLPAELSDLPAQWPSLTPPERRSLMRAAMLCVFVRAMDSGATLPERARIVWRGAVAELPRKGHIAWMPQPADFDDLDRQVGVSRVTLAQD